MNSIMKKRKAVYAASLDPITNGHINIIERMAPLYDELAVLVAVDSRKTYTFTPEERVDMTKAAVANLKNVSVDVCIGHYVVKQAESIGAQVIIRGLRNFKDLEDEQTLAEENRKICPHIETVWVPCFPNLMHVSSSMVKGHVGADPHWEDQVARSVPASVVVKLKDKFILGKAKKYWTSLMSMLGNPKGSEAVLTDLLARYGEPHRAYHNLAHIVAMLDEFELISNQSENPDVVRWAIWHHDGIYDPRSKGHPKIAGNEARSAYLSDQNVERLGLGEEFGSYAGKLVQITAHTSPPSNRDEKIIVDLDLAVFGKTEKEFDAYEVGIRKEYKRVPQADFRVRRSKILQSFLDRSSIYLTDYFLDKYEGAAQKNLERSIKKLQK